MTAYAAKTASTQNMHVQNGLSGLRNLGNTCFMNSCMQILSHTASLNLFLEEPGSDGRPAYISKLSSEDNVDEMNMIHEWDKVRQLLWKKNCVVTPTGFLHAMRRVAMKYKQTLFTGFSQNDVSEFLRFILNSFHSGIKREVSMNICGTSKSDNDTMAVKCYEMFKAEYSKAYSEIIPLFYGVQVTIISEAKHTSDGMIPGEQLSLRPEPCFLLSLPLPQGNKNSIGSISIRDCFEEYCRQELLDEDNKWYNEDTKKKEVVYKRHMFWSLPEVLVVDVKRFNRNGTKIMKPIQLDMELSMADLMVGYNKENSNYELYGVCNHSGNCSGGHYTAHIKCADSKWYLFNDTIVTEDKKFSGRDNVLGYTLFYKRIV